MITETFWFLPSTYGRRGRVEMNEEQQRHPERSGIVQCALDLSDWPGVDPSSVARSDRFTFATPFTTWATISSQNSHTSTDPPSSPFNEVDRSRVLETQELNPCLYGYTSLSATNHTGHLDGVFYQKGTTNTILVQIHSPRPPHTPTVPTDPNVAKGSMVFGTWGAHAFRGGRIHRRRPRHRRKRPGVGYYVIISKVKLVHGKEEEQ